METNDLWEALGDLKEDQAFQVLIQLFTRYEERREHHPNDPAIQVFFQDLEAILTQVSSCNISRR